MEEVKTSKSWEVKTLLSALYVIYLIITFFIYCYITKQAQMFEGKLIYFSAALATIVQGAFNVFVLYMFNKINHKLNQIIRQNDIILEEIQKPKPIKKVQIKKAQG